MSQPALAHAAWMPTNSHGGEVWFTPGGSYDLTPSLTTANSSTAQPAPKLLIVVGLVAAALVAWGR